MKTVSQKGFSVVEVLVALALLTFGIYSAADMITAARRTGAITARGMQATALAQLKLEELRASGAVAGASAIPTTGFAMFEQNPAYAWRAEVAKSTATTGSVEILVHVAPAGKTEPDQELARLRGFAWVSSENTAGAH